MDHIRPSRLAPALWFCALAWAMACGESHDGAQCDDYAFDACGGDPTGMWRVVDSCTDHTVAPPDPPAPECEGYFEVAGWRVDGTIWYAASGGYEADMRVLVDGTVRIDNDCSIALIGAELSSTSP